MQQIISNSPTYSCDQSTVFYNMVGNFVPPEWQNLTHPSGKVLSKTARQLLSLVVSCFESESNNVTDELQESYYFFQQQLGVCQRRVRQCLVELQQAGFINVELLTIIKHHIKCRIPSIKLLKNFNSLQKEKSFQANLKEISGQAEENFRLERKNFQPLNIIDYNISILESRSTKSDFVNLSKSDLSKKIDDEFELKSDLVAEQERYDTQESPSVASAGLLSKIATKAKSLCGFRKKLVEFHPLDEGDASCLQMRSGREFNLKFINLLLLKLSKQYPDHSFPNKKAFLSYMTKALACEMRDVVKVNNESFRFKQDEDVSQQEKYLQEVEYNKDTSQVAQLRRKIAAMFEAQVAYKLLTSCSFNDPQGNCYRLPLIKDIVIPKLLQEALLKEIQAVYGNSLEHMEIIPYVSTHHQSANGSKASTKAVDHYAHLQSLDSKSVWFKVRQQLIQACGVHIDKNWFSKLEVVKEDQATRKLVLKASSSFVNDWVKVNYENVLQSACATQDFVFEMTKY